MAVYTNDLRLKEIATGDEAGTWGNSTNTNLQLIADAFGFGTEAITTNADTHTTTIADGSADAGRAIFLKYTGTLDSACTITIGPNTVSKLWFIENATSGSQNIIIKQGSGATVTIPAGDTKAIYSDGAGSGGAMVDAFASLNVVDLKVEDDLTVTDDLIVNGDIDLEGSIDVNGTANLDVVDIDGAVDMASTLQVDGAITSSAGATITVADNSDVLTLVSTDADANAGPILALYRNSASPADADSTGRINFQAENSAGETITYSQIFSSVLDVTDGTEDGRYKIGTMVAGSFDSRMDMTNTETVFNEDSVDLDFRVESNGNANMLFVDGGNDQVSIKTGSAINNGALSVAGTIAFDGQTAGTYNDASGWIDFTSTSDTNLMRLHSGGDSGESSQIEISTVISGSQSDAISVESGGTIVINQDSVNARDFRVESDSLANMFVVDSGDSRVFIGKNANTSFDAYGSAIMMQLEAAGTSPYAGFGMVQNSNDADSAVLIFGKSRGTSVASTTIVQDDDVCGRIEFQGMDGGDLETCARIMGSVDGTPGTDDMPGRLTFATTPDGANTPVERLRILSTGAMVTGGLTSTTGHLHLYQDASFSGKLILQSQVAANATADITLMSRTSDNTNVNATLTNVTTALQSSLGISFGSDTAEANALDDYEEGSATLATSGYVISSQSVTYQKIGNTVHLRGRVVFSTVGTNTSSVVFSGAPFPGISGQAHGVGVARETTSFGDIFVCQLSSGTSNFSMNSMDGVTSGSHQTFATSKNYDFSITYRTT